MPEITRHVEDENLMEKFSAGVNQHFTVVGNKLRKKADKYFLTFVVEPKRSGRLALKYSFTAGSDGYTETHWFPLTIAETQSPRYYLPLSETEFIYHPSARTNDRILFPIQVHKEFSNYQFWVEERAIDVAPYDREPIVKDLPKELAGRELGILSDKPRFLPYMHHLERYRFETCAADGSAEPELALTGCSVMLVFQIHFYFADFAAKTPGRINLLTGSGKHSIITPVVVLSDDKVNTIIPDEYYNSNRHAQISQNRYPLNQVVLRPGDVVTQRYAHSAVFFSDEVFPTIRKRRFARPKKAWGYEDWLSDTPAFRNVR